MSSDNVPNSASDLTFGTPTPSTRGRKSVYALRAKKMAEILPSTPDKWALYRSGLSATHASSTATTYRKRFTSLEWMVQRENDGTYSVWVRFPSGNAPVIDLV